MIGLAAQTYDSYKASEFPWLDRYPTGWKLAQLKSCAAYQEGPGIMTEDFHDAGVPLIRISGMKGNTVTLDGCNFLDPGKVTRRWNHFRLRAGELVVSASATTGIAARVDEQSAGAIPYTGLIRFRPKKFTDTGFLQYFLVSRIFTDQIDYHKSGSTIQHYGPTHLGRVFALIPPFLEQQAIAKYLDRKTGAIDRKVELLEKKAQLYRDLKQSLINETVTHGLDKAAPLRDSGVDWIGQIPAHWKLVRIKDIGRESKTRNGNTPVGDMLSVSGYRGIEVKDYDHEHQKRTVEELRDYRVVKPGQLVVNTMWLNYRGLGVSPHVGYVSPAYRVYTINDEIFGAYLHHLMRSDLYVFGYCIYLQGIRPNSLQMKTGDFESFPIVLPPIEEQTKIVSYLEEKTRKLDRIVETIETQIDKLKELRKTLINDIVTGKTRVTQLTTAEAV